jgi:hypothetical protein
MSKESEAIEQLRRISKNLGNLGESEDYTDIAIEAIQKNKEYQELESRLQNIFGGEVPLSMIVDELELKLREPDNPHPINAKILTYEDAAEWERYKALGTADECEAAMKFMKQNA